jgi:hypothetical protein
MDQGSHTFVDWPSLSTKSTNSCLTLLLERQVNELANTFERYQESSDKQLQRTDEKLTRLLEVVSRLTPDGIASTATSRASSLSPATPGPKLYLSNPVLTPEFIAIISKVVSETRSRVGKKKGGADDNSMKVSLNLLIISHRYLCLTGARTYHILPDAQHTGC